MPRTTVRCIPCGAFVKTTSKRCQRCVRTANAASRLTRRAERALTHLKRVSAQEHWKLPKLRRAMRRERKRLGLGHARWEMLVRGVFGTSSHDIVDPRQMFSLRPYGDCVKKKTKSNVPDVNVTVIADGAIRTMRWIAKDSTGRELIVYNRHEMAARAMFESSKLLTGEYTVRPAGHIDDQGRLYINDAPLAVIDRRTTS